MVKEPIYVIFQCFQIYGDLFGGLARGLSCRDVQVHCWVHLSLTADTAILSLRLLSVCVSVVKVGDDWVRLFLLLSFVQLTVCLPWRCCVFSTSYPVVGVCPGPFISLLVCCSACVLLCASPFLAFFWIIFVLFHFSEFVLSTPEPQLLIHFCYFF